MQEESAKRFIFFLFRRLPRRWKEGSITYNATSRAHGLCLAPKLIAHALDVIHAIENDDGVAAQGALHSRKGHRSRLLL